MLEELENVSETLSDCSNNYNFLFLFLFIVYFYFLVLQQIYKSINDSKVKGQTRIFSRTSQTRIFIQNFNDHKDMFNTHILHLII